MSNKYGYSKTDPDYWLKTSQAIWNDNSMTTDEKFQAQEALTKEYLGEKREKKTITRGVKTQLHANIRNAIGYSQSESDERVKTELKRLKTKSDATWKAIEKRAGMTKKEILKTFGL